jgi:hypothetical protein
MSAILVQPGTGRISAVGQGVKSASLSLEYLLQEQDIATAFGNLYQQAALLAMERLQGRPLSREGIPQLMTNVAISAADLRTLFDISGDTELTERNCQSSACRTLANLLGQLGTEYLAQHQHFALPPLMGTMSPRGSKWGNHASMQTVNLIGIRLADPRALDRYAININPARVQQHIALELPEAEAHNVSRYPQVQQWEFKVQGHLLTCANRIPQLSSEAFAQLENRQSKLCAAEYRQGRGLAFDNNHTPASYKGLSAPDDDIRRDAFIGAIYNAFYPEKR